MSIRTLPAARRRAPGGLPEVRTPGPDEVGGRGLARVESLSSRWGVTATVGGKRVWFEIGARPTPFV